MKDKQKVPNIVRGGVAIPLGKNLYYLEGRTHEQGGIDIGSNPKTGIEAERGEIVQMKPDEIRILSAQPMLGGISPAEAVIRGVNPDKAFNAQERFKDVNRFNDDGSSYKCGGRKKAENGIVQKVNKSKANFVNRLKTPFRQTIPDWETQYNDGFLKPKSYSTHKLSAWEGNNGIGIIVPNVQEVNGKLIDFTRPPYNDRAAIENAYKTNNVVEVDNFDDALWYTENYKNFYPKFKCGGKNKKSYGGFVTINGNVKNGLLYTPRMACGGRKKAELGKEYVFARPDINRNSKGNINAYDKMTGIGRSIYLLQKDINNKEESKIDEKLINDVANIDFSEISYDNIQPVTEEELKAIVNNKDKKDKNTKVYHEISGNSLNAIGRAINRKTGYIFTKEGNKTFRTPDISKIIFTNRPDTVKNIQAIWANDFVRKSNETGSSNYAKQFRNPNYIIDGEIPISKISRFYGNKNGKFIVGDLSEFDDNDYIAAVRNKSMLFDNVKLNNGNIEFYYNGKPVESTIKGNKHFIYNKDKGSYTLITNPDEIEKTYKAYQDFLLSNGIADLVMLDDGRFEDHIYKGGRNLTDEEISDYYRNDFNRGIDKVPVLIQGSMKRCGGRKKADFGLTTKTKDNKEFKADFSLVYPDIANALAYGFDYAPGKSISYFSPSAFGESADKIINIDSSTGGRTERTLNYADPLRPWRSIGSLYDEGYYNNSSGISSFNNRRIGSMSYNTEINTMPVIIPTSIEEPTPAKNTTTPAKTTKTTFTKNPTETSNPYSYLLKPSTISLTPISDLNADLQSYIDRNKVGYNTPVTKTSTINLPNVLDYIGLGANIVGNITSGLLTNKALTEVPLVGQTAASASIPAAKLKTRYNINPQLSQIEDDTRRMFDEISHNTASSNVALARKQASMLAGQRAKNELYGTKENVETELYNKDALNRQQVAAQNVANYQEYLNNDMRRKMFNAQLEYENKLAKASNVNNMFSGIVSGVQDLINKLEQRRALDKTLAAIKFRNPNAPDITKKW